MAETAVLGAGPAGLSFGHYARRAGLPFTLFEAAGRVGGNAVTFRWRGFRYDSGAHRFHDRDPQITAELLRLPGLSLHAVSAPSRILSRGRRVDFPLSAAGLFRGLGPAYCARAGASLLWARLAGENGRGFEGFARRAYGHELAERFLLGYSQKLWGLPCRELSPRIGGRRLGALNVATLLREALLGGPSMPAHLEGDFLYPEGGFGAIAEALADSCGRENIELGRRVTGVFHERGRVTAIELDGEDRRPVSEAVSTLPVGMLAGLLRPLPPAPILSLARSLRFRDLILVAVFLDTDSAGEEASLYFPDPELPFTRVTEPRNRCRTMAPPGRTSLVAELPCFAGDAVSRASDEALAELVVGRLAALGRLRRGQVIGSEVRRLARAYPVLDAGVEETLRPVHDWLSGLGNLHLTGRNALFAYTHLHDILRDAHRVAHRAAAATPSRVIA